MSERKGVSRRQAVGALAAVPLAAQSSKTFLSEHEFATLRLLCDLIIPADEVSPAASEAGTAEYIDLLCRGNEKLARLYHGGLAWLDGVSGSLHGVPFREATEAQQTAILEKLAYRDKTPSDWKAGALFFEWARRMTLDGFYTSQIGYKDVGYKGSHGMTTYHVPEEALRQALDRVKL